MKFKNRNAKCKIKEIIAAVRQFPNFDFLFLISRGGLIFEFPWVIVVLVGMVGCVSEKVPDHGILSSYQEILARQGPQQRLGSEGIDLLSPSPETAIPGLKVLKDPNTGKTVVHLSVEDAIIRALANSPEIRVVSLDPSIAKQEITKAAAEFDVTAFGRLNYEQEDNPVNSLVQIGQSEVRTLESGLKQKTVTGSELSAGYALTRSWDDLIGRTFPKRYEPIMVFQLRQPLLRDGWPEVNLAGVNIAKLNHEIALLGFRQKSEEISTQVIAAYWLLLQARRDLEVQQDLLDKTFVTLKKLQVRKEIDATSVQVKQAEASLKARQSALLQTQKSVFDAQDVLIRLLADPWMNTLSESELVPVTAPHLTAEELESSAILKQAMAKNPRIQQAQVAIAIAAINIAVAENQQMPRLDLVASTSVKGLDPDPWQSLDRLHSNEYVSYAVGLSLECPLGNRQRNAELLRRKFERKKAVSALQNLADQVAVQAKEKIRKVRTNHAQIEVEKDSVQAARIHLQALEDSEAIRERLTPEFLLVKLRAQEALADAQRAEIRAIVDFNIALVELAEATGTVLELHNVQMGLSAVTSSGN